MAKVLGLGGVFFKCPDVDSYRAWWSEHMGVKVADWGSMEWESDGQGRTMLSPFKSNTDYLNPSAHNFMINLRVDDTRALIKQAEAGGATVIGEVDDTEYGIFGWFIDPAGIKVELWQEPE